MQLSETEINAMTDRELFTHAATYCYEDRLVELLAERAMGLLGIIAEIKEETEEKHPTLEHINGLADIEEPPYA